MILSSPSACASTPIEDHIVAYTEKEGGAWKPFHGKAVVTVGYVLNLQHYTFALDTTTLAAIKTSKGHVYDFVLGRWRPEISKVLLSTDSTDPAPHSIEATLHERESRYGNFMHHAEITQTLKDVMYATPKWCLLLPDQRECLEMIAHKIGRILNGDPHYADSWHDIAGYATLVDKRLQQDELEQVRGKC